MFKKYNVAIKSSSFIVLVFSVLIFTSIYLYSGSLKIIFDKYYIILPLVLLLFLCCFFIIHIRVENFIYLKVKSIYKDLLPKGLPIAEDSLQKDVEIITNSIQKFAKDSKLEIQLLKDKENYRKEFVGNLAHELKTPFFTVQGYILTLLEGNVKDRKLIQKYLEKASNATDRLGYIIKDVDLITQFETGVTNLKIEKFDFCQLIKDLVDSFEIKMKQKGIEITYDFGNEKSIFVTADNLRITQVMSNLIVNSLNYGVENGTTEIVTKNVSKEKILVRVIDNGQGISEEDLPRVFERFYRVDKTRNRQEGGSGLGLAIVKHIVEAHNEIVYVESSLNVGSEFSFTLTKSD
ncbi:MAG: two-component sensor histidine kinase [Flavobacteriaceae bacterium]|nr:two-component sensor histidine kinase [Flavobacteriaceae bacterium]